MVAIDLFTRVTIIRCQKSVILRQEVKGYVHSWAELEMLVVTGTEGGGVGVAYSMTAVCDTVLRQNQF